MSFDNTNVKYYSTVSYVLGIFKITTVYSLNLLKDKFYPTWTEEKEGCLGSSCSSEKRRHPFGTIFKTLD